ncbi:hypothetical protein AGOR_G00150790 [Albula goreensis]|uniref:Uncharacterized protein n=1 Tax=Albula goreensis TaxID=1534307 RepID=A0A8T3D7K0_9TELE|nr:hypothetical protein AGOR_G00150790 [Albula goreensis]
MHGVTFLESLIPTGLTTESGITLPVQKLWKQENIETGTSFDGTRMSSVHLTTLPFGFSAHAPGENMTSDTGPGMCLLVRGCFSRIWAILQLCCCYCCCSCCRHTRPVELRQDQLAAPSQSGWQCRGAHGIKRKNVRGMWLNSCGDFQQFLSDGVGQRTEGIKGRLPCRENVAAQMCELRSVRTRPLDCGRKKTIEDTEEEGLK